jgi:hypothetical protein
MATTAAIVIGSDRWNEQVNEVLSLATEMVTGLDHPTGLAMFSAWRTNRWLDWMNREVERILATIDRSLPLTPGNPVENFRSMRDSVLRLHAICVRLLSLREVAGQDGKKLEKLALLEANSERLLDVADWLDAMSAPEETNIKFDLALADLTKGDVVPWAAV